jgi:hypothetical protein
VQQQDSILKTLQTRINDIEQSIAVFPLEYQPDKKTSEAIEGGAALIKDSNQKQIESSQDNSTVAQVMSSSELVSIRTLFHFEFETNETSRSLERARTIYRLE